MHAIGACLGLIGLTIVVTAGNVERIEIAPILVYVIGLVTMLALSAAYNMWPVLPAKWVLRRFDHSAIYRLIAGTYTLKYWWCSPPRTGIASVRPTV